MNRLTDDRHTVVLNELSWDSSDTIAAHLSKIRIIYCLEQLSSKSILLELRILSRLQDHVFRARLSKNVLKRWPK